MIKRNVFQARLTIKHICKGYSSGDLGFLNYFIK